MANCLLLLNDGTSNLLLNDGSSKLLLNDNTCGVAAEGSSGGLAKRHRKRRPPTPIFDSFLEEETFSLFLILKPFKIMIFFQDVRLVPRIKQYQIILMDVFFTPVTKSYESLSRFMMKPSLAKETIVNIAMKQNPKPFIKEYMIADGIMKIKAVINSKYSQSIKLKALNGINMIRRAAKIIEDNKMSFDFEEDRIEWLGVTNRPPIGEPEEEEREKDFTQSSSFVGHVVYSPDLSTMEISLNGRIYGFCNVPERVFTSFKGAGSKGAFFNRSIKGLYNC